MKKHIVFPLALCALLAGGCNKAIEEIFKITTSDSTTFDVDPTEEIKEDDKKEEESEKDQSVQDIVESEEEITLPDEHVDVEQDDEIKTDGESYYLQGNYSDVFITAKKGSEIYIYLDGATITSTKGIAFGSDKAITLHLIILNNSVNTISNNYEAATEDDQTNAFHVKGDVYISGEGTLNVTSSVKNAIKVSKNLVICPGVTINATGANHAIGAQSFSCSGATLNLSSKAKDGINVECDGELATYSTEQGYVYLKDTTLTIDSYGDGIQAATFVEISGGTTTITTHGNFIAYTSSLVSSGDYTKDDFKFLKSGNTYKRVATDEIRSLSSSYYALETSVKGIKVSGIEYEDESGNALTQETGDYVITIHHLANVTINSTDDAVHTNYGDVSLDSANLVLDSFDDGVHADYDLTVNNCAIQINSSYEGLEGANVTIDGEDTNIVSISSDDGINAASDYGTSHNITINNGYFRVYASGDGLDANTALYLNGGTVIVEGPGSNNGSLDAEQIYFNGGIVFACSTNGMLERMSAKQATFVYSGSSIASGTSVSICDSNNSALFTYTLKQSCSQLIFSSPNMSVGSSYKIVKNGSTVVTTISLSSTLTKVGTSGGGGGGGNPGGGGHGGR